MIPRPIVRKPNSSRPDNYLKQDTPNKPTEIIDLFNGINVAYPSYEIADNEAIFISNGYRKDGVFRKCPGLNTFGTTLPLDAKLWGIINYKVAVGTTDLLAITSKSVYYLAASDIWTYVTGGQDAFTGSADQRVNFQSVYSETAGDFIVIFTNYKDYVHYYDGAAIGHLFTDWKAKYTKNYDNYQFYAFILESAVDYPQKIYWSDIGKPETITGGLSGGIVLAKTPDFVTGMAILRGALFVGKEKSCSLINSTGSYTSPFSLSENVLDIGVICGATMANIGDELLLLANDKKVYITDGYSKKDLTGKIKSVFSDRLNWNKIGRSYGWISPDDRYYFISVPTTGNDEPSETWMLNLTDWTWQPFQAWNKINASEHYEDTGLKVGEITSKLSGCTWKIGDLATLEKRTLVGDTDGYVYDWNESYINNAGSAIDFYVDTKDFVWDKKLMKRVTEVILDISGYGTIDIYYSLDEGLNWTFINDITMSTDFDEKFVYPNINCNKVRFRFRCNRTNEYCFIRKLLINKIDKGIIADA